MEEMEGINDVFVFIKAHKTPSVFLNDGNRKTATQNSQKPKNCTRFQWENANRKLPLKPQNRTKTARKIDENRKITKH